MFEGFVHPALAFGAGLAAVPLVIHLLNRQRHRPVRWAAMRFVLAAYRRTRRRVQLENLLLLLLRMAAVALLALAVARPFATGESPLAALTEERRDVVVVLDASASTGYREDVETVFERIVARARALASELDAARGDRIRVLLAGEYPRLLSWTTPDKALSVLATLQAPTDEPLDLAQALGEVLGFVERDAAGTGRSTLEVRLLSDLQRSSFEDRPTPGDPETDAPAAGESDPLIVEQLDALAEYGVRVLVEDFGPADAVPGNLSITHVLPLQPILGAGVPVEVAVGVANHGPTPRAAVRVALEVDGERQPSQRVDVPAGDAVEAVFALQFGAAGASALVARLEGDRLAADDVRADVVLVPEPVRVLLVDGDRKDRIEDDETGYLLAVLEPTDDGQLPGAGSLSPFDPREVTPDLVEDPGFDMTDFDVVVLANVEAPSPGLVTRLEGAVAGGASLIVTLGDRVRPKTWGERMFRIDGSGLLPAELIGSDPVTSAGDDYYRVAGFDAAHPAFDFFTDDRWRPLLTEVPVFTFYRTRPLESARVLAWLDDQDQSPLLVERAYDRGRVFLWTTSIDRAWTRIPESPRTLVPLVHELTRYAARRAAPPRNVAPGEVVALHVPAFPRNPELVRPDGSRRTLDGESVEVGDGSWRLPELAGADTERAGLYRIELEGARSEPFAVQLDPREGDLARVAPAELGALHPALVALERGASEHDDEDRPRRGEVWRWLALAALLALVGESAWGAWIGHRRRAA